MDASQECFGSGFRETLEDGRAWPCSSIFEMDMKQVVCYGH